MVSPFALFALLEQLEGLGGQLADGHLAGGVVALFGQLDGALVAREGREQARACGIADLHQRLDS